MHGVEIEGKPLFQNHGTGIEFLISQLAVSVMRSMKILSERKGTAAKGFNNSKRSKPSYLEGNVPYKVPTMNFSI